LKKLNYQQAYDALQRLIEELENDASIDLMPGKIKEAMQLLQICKNKLRDANDALEEAKNKSEEN